MTHNSAWTPVNHKPSNDQIFLERRELITHWFDLWTDSQRKRFLDVILKKCGKSQLLFTHNWFEAKAVLTRVDPTTVLPRFLTLYIFSMLDAKTLSRASQVSWAWKFIAEQDCLWRPKCARFGWYLPYRPTSTEYGSWKKHYIHCVLNLDLATNEDAMYRSLTEAQKMAALYERMDIVDGGHRVKPLPISEDAAREILNSRPPWYGSSKSTKDIEHANKALLYGFNPNDPAADDHTLKHHNKFGQLRTRSRSATTPNSAFGLKSKSRRSTHRSISVGPDGREVKVKLSEVTISKYHKALEKALNELKSRPWEPVNNHARSGVANSDDYGYTASGGQRRVKTKNPRIVFISSRVPAAEMLHDAVKNEVYPIPYEYEGTTIDNLIDRLQKLLDGQLATSIALVAHSTQPGELCLTQSNIVTLDKLDEEQNVWFFQNLANHTLASKDGGSIDIFCPLAASEPGTEMLIQLNILSGHKFTAPTGVSGQWNQWYCDWYGYTNITPTDLYFQMCKVQQWSAMAEVVTEAIEHTRHELRPYFEQNKSEVMSQLTGQIVTDAMALGNIHGLSRVAPIITESLTLLGTQHNADPLEFVTQFFLEKLKERKKTSLSKSFDGEEEKRDLDKDVTELGEKEGSLMNDSYSETFLTTGRNISTLSTSKEMTALRRRKGAFTSSLSTMPQAEYADHPDRRFVTAKEILSTETSYNQELDIVKRIFVVPLKRSIESNRAVVANSTLQQLFSDIMIIHDINKEFLSELKLRTRDWSASQCIGEVFVKFAVRLGSYMNYIAQYPSILLTFDREIEVNPGFRAFLKRQEGTPATKMKGLHQFYLAPILRITAYVRLLSWMKANTPRDNPDREDITSALNQFKQVDTIIRQTRSRIQRDRKLVSISRMIEGCPQLLEANRMFILRQDFSLMVAQSRNAASMPHDSRLYTHVEDIGLFLFNDALMFTHVLTGHHAFERSVSKTYLFKASVSLVGLRVKDLPDSRYMRNAFKLTCDTEEWILSSETHEMKFEFLNSLESSIKTAIQDF
ncbi:epithelial cell-transforming sequence 2 oncogene-like [Watersipora subatra]|uniref:epithelial cell-transforming sequence 2 oncogene-like n=1 Tax=Watersipora subatra TaxID=2589382 RepID=UPI00355C6A5C